MSLRFDQPRGAAADVRELEYISALHQTSDILRRDGSITAQDVARYLLSRHGLKVQDPQVVVAEHIFSNGFSTTTKAVDPKKKKVPNKNGDDEKDEETEEPEETDEPFLDLAEIVGILLIPELIKASKAVEAVEVADDTDEEADAAGATKKDTDEFEGRRDANDIIGNVLDLVLEQATGRRKSSTDDDDDDEPPSVAPPILDADLLRKILIHHGEKILAQDDDLIHDMIEMAKTSPASQDDDDDDDVASTTTTTYLDRQSFARALVADVEKKYRLQDDDDLTTIYFDVFQEERQGGSLLSSSSGPAGRLFQKKKQGAAESSAPSSSSTPDAVNKKDDGTTPGYAAGLDNVESQEEEEGPQPAGSSDNNTQLKNNKNIPHDNKEDEDEKSDKAFKAKAWRSVPTFASIDYMADTFRSKTVAVMLWTFFLTHLLASGSFGLQDFPQLVPTQLDSCQNGGTGCIIVETFLNWVNVIFTMALVGGIIIVGISSLGNSIVQPSSNKLFGMFFAILSFGPVIYFIVKMFTFGTTPTDYDDQYHRAYALVMSFIVGVICLLAQLRNFSYVYLIPHKVLDTHARLKRVFVGDQVRSEAYAKQAASHKANLMMKNAYEVSCTTNKEERRGHPVSQSILGYMKKDWELERKGGYWWAWRAALSHELYRKEGVRISSRLLAGNLIQLLIVLYMVLFTVWVTGDIIRRFEEAPTYIIVTSTNYATNWVFGNLQRRFNLGTDWNSSLVLRVADGTIDTFYDRLLPAVTNLTLGSCDELSSLLNISQAEEMCSATFNYTEQELINVCANTNVTIDMEMACSGVDALSGNANLISTLCSASEFTDMYATCNRTVNDISGSLPPAETVKALVRVSLTQSVDSFTSFLRSWFDAGVQSVSDYVKVYQPIQPWMIQVAFGLGGLLAFFASIILSAAYFPSIVSTTLKFRTGVIPSLRDPNFAKYRQSVQGVTLIMGGMFWGTLLYCGAIIFVVAVIVLVVCVAVNSGAGSGNVLGWIVGTGLAFIVQAFLYGLCGLVTYKSFYRNRPAAANVFSLIWESAWLGLTILVVIMRMVKLIFVAALEVGRFDKPFLADGVGEIGPVHLDLFPRLFRQDILSHEAHLHPYIERLGKMYLMKLRHGELFASRAGSCWRLLFVVALMPWVRTYRMLARPELFPSRESPLLTIEAPPDEEEGEVSVSL